MCVWERNNWQLRLQLQLRLQFGCIYTSATKFSAASTTLHKSFIYAFYMTRTSVMGPCSLINSLPNVTAAGIQSNFLYQEKHTHTCTGDAYASVWTSWTELINLNRCDSCRYERGCQTYGPRAKDGPIRCWIRPSLTNFDLS